MATTTIKGKVLDVTAVEQGTSKTGKEWKKKTVYVEETAEKYPKKIAFSLFGDKTDIIITPGQDVTVDCDISSREYQGRYFTELTAFKVVVDKPF